MFDYLYAKPEQEDRECLPIDTFADLHERISDPPSWAKKLIDLKQQPTECIANSDLRCHYKDNQNVYSLVPSIIPLNNVPRTIVCHDMKNGYLEDRFVDGSNVGNGYPFYLWQFIDTFIYFSHHFITLPPLQWINTAHENGVQILGTLITEWEGGELRCEEFLDDLEHMTEFINALVELTIIYKIDGWLINIENVIKPDLLENLKLFICTLTKQIHEAKPGSIVLWYDSVIDTGELKWQNELNNKNGVYFNLCDGILLNYTWTILNLENTKKYINEISDRAFDVYLGIDVFGRNTCYAPGPGCAKALIEARRYNLSTCIFAPGWTHETLDPEPQENFFQRFYDCDRKFWSALWPYLYTHLIKSLVNTNFEIGAGSKYYDLLSQRYHIFNVPCDNTSKKCDCLHWKFCAKRSYYLLRANCDKGTLYPLMATAIDLSGVYMLYIDINIPPVAIDEVQLVLIVQNNLGLRKLYCPAKTDCEDNTDSIVCNNLVNHFALKLYYEEKMVSVVKQFEIKFQEVTKLRYIYISLPKNKPVLLTALGFKKLR